VTRRGRAVLRLTALLCLAGAIALVASARFPDERAVGASARSEAPTLRTPLASPRRLPSLFTDALGRARLQRALEAIAARATTCIAVDDMHGPLARVNSDTALAPASNTKLLTALAALEVLGPGYRFRTRVVAAGTNLVLVGGGDPVLSSSAPPSGPATRLDELADAVAATGRRTFGSLIVDDSRFDASRDVADWRPSYVPDGEVGALGALSTDRGFVDAPSRTAASDPAVLTGERFQALLRVRGMMLPGSPIHAVAAPNVEEVAHIDSPPLSEIIADMLRTSDNFVAEMITREIGFRRRIQGTTAAGTKAIVEAATSLGVPTAGTVLHDGSGLAPDNRVTCSALLRVVRTDQRSKFAAIDEGLAVAGRSGTLALRFLDDPLAGVLRAKTGSIDGVVALSGTIDAGVRPRFAFIANGAFSE
jgi:serine-type D-Ala-D-Ala carboxypeptidase/endopeptidase (penicillin-binding protein 4)